MEIQKELDEYKALNPEFPVGVLVGGVEMCVSFFFFFSKTTDAMGFFC